MRYRSQITFSSEVTLQYSLVNARILRVAVPGRDWHQAFSGCCFKDGQVVQVYIN